MGQWIAVLIIIVVAAVIIPWAVSAMQRDRRGKGSGGGFGPALLELDRVLNPSNTHAIEARRGPISEEDADGEPKDQPPPDDPR